MALILSFARGVSERATANNVELAHGLGSFVVAEPDPTRDPGSALPRDRLNGPRHHEFSAVHAVATLGDDLDQLTAVFLAEFTDPAKELPYSSADGGYQWFVQEWDTEDAVLTVFGSFLDEETFCELVSALEDMSPSWASLAELSRVHE